MHWWTSGFLSHSQGTQNQRWYLGLPFPPRTFALPSVSVAKRGFMGPWHDFTNDTHFIVDVGTSLNYHLHANMTAHGSIKKRMQSEDSIITLTFGRVLPFQGCKSPGQIDSIVLFVLCFLLLLRDTNNKPIKQINTYSCFSHQVSYWNLHLANWFSNGVPRLGSWRGDKSSHTFIPSSDHLSMLISRHFCFPNLQKILGAMGLWFLQKNLPAWRIPTWNPIGCPAFLELSKISPVRLKVPT